MMNNTNESRNGESRITDEEIVRAIRDAGASDRDWRALTHDSGPYDITTPNLFTRMFVERIARLAAEAGWNGAMKEASDLAQSERRTNFPPPTEAEISAYRDRFRLELKENMNNRSASPSTDAHRVALRAFVANRNVGANRHRGETDGKM